MKEYEKRHKKYVWRRQTKNERIPKKYMFEENKQKYTEYMEEYKKSTLKNVLKKLNENN